MKQYNAYQLNKIEIDRFRNGISREGLDYSKGLDYRIVSFHDCVLEDSEGNEVALVTQRFNAGFTAGHVISLDPRIDEILESIKDPITVKGESQ